MTAVVATRIVVGVLLGSIGGTVADRLPLQPLMWSLDLVRGALVLVIAWMVTSPSSSFPLILVLTALVTVVSQFRNPAFSAALVQILGADQLSRASSMV